MSWTTEKERALQRLINIATHIGEELQPDVTDTAWDQHIVELAAALKEAREAINTFEPDSAETPSPRSRTKDTGIHPQDSNVF